MEFTVLGRTGLKVSVAGLGCGGHSRLGMANGRSADQAANIVRHALDLGMNFVDTAAAYGTEAIVGQGLSGRRQDIVISTKSGISNKQGFRSAADLVESLDNSLRNLKTDYIDVFNLHGVTLTDYDHAIDVMLPALKHQQSLGKIRYLGITEAFIRDPGHLMLQRALPADNFDVVMVGFNLLNPSARLRVFPSTQANHVATQIMFAVRRALSQKSALTELVIDLSDKNLIEDVDLNDPLGFVREHPDVESIVQAAYRFCRHEPGATVVLTGTGSVEHLTENVAAILAPPLPKEIHARLTKIFGAVDSVSGN